MFKGIVKFFNENKGYGFIAGDDGRDVFVHARNIIIPTSRILQEGETVEYNVVESERGLRAEDVKAISEDRR